MDSRGLGQLAYEKWMRRLAATQAHNKALGSGQAKHGLLTYALVCEGIETKQADFKPKDKYSTLHELFQYSIQRVPVLCQKLLKGKIFRRGFQQPALFAFTKRSRDFILLFFQ